MTIRDFLIRIRDGFIGVVTPRPENQTVTTLPVHSPISGNMSQHPVDAVHPVLNRTIQQAHNGVSIQRQPATVARAISQPIQNAPVTPKLYTNLVASSFPNAAPPTGVLTPQVGNRTFNPYNNTLSAPTDTGSFDPYAHLVSSAKYGVYDVGFDIAPKGSPYAK